MMNVEDLDAAIYLAMEDAKGIADKRHDTNAGPLRNGLRILRKAFDPHDDVMNSRFQLCELDGIVLFRIGENGTMPLTHRLRDFDCAIDRGT